MLGIEQEGGDLLGGQAGRHRIHRLLLLLVELDAGAIPPRRSHPRNIPPPRLSFARISLDLARPPVKTTPWLLHRSALISTLSSPIGGLWTHVLHAPPKPVRLLKPMLTV